MFYFLRHQLQVQPAAPFWLPSILLMTLFGVIIIYGLGSSHGMDLPWMTLWVALGLFTTTSVMTTVALNTIEPDKVRDTIVAFICSTLWSVGGLFGVVVVVCTLYFLRANVGVWTADALFALILITGTARPVASAISHLNPTNPILRDLKGLQ